MRNNLGLSNGTHSYGEGVSFENAGVLMVKVSVRDRGEL